MNGARRQFLAGTRRPDDEDSAVGGRDLLDGLAQMLHDAGGADEHRRMRRELLELLDLPLQPRGLEGAIGDKNEAVDLERFLDEVVGALLDGRDRGLDIAVAGNHDHRQIGMLRLDAGKHLQAIEAAPLQPDVQEDQIGAARRNRCRRVVAVASGACRVALVFENSRDQFADIGLVVDNQDIRRHAVARPF